MCDVIVGHGENRNLCDTSVATVHTAGTLVDGAKIGVHVTGVTTTAGHLLTSGRHLTQRIGITTHVSENDQHVLLGLIGKVFGRGESKTWRDDALNGGIVGQVQEESHTLQRAVLLEILLEETSSLRVHTHRSENNRKVVLVIIHHTLTGSLHQTGLTTDLSSNFIVWKTGSGENGDLLTTSDRVHGINRRDTCLNHLLRIDTSERIDRLSHNIEVVSSKNRRALIDWDTTAVEYTTEHILRNRNAHHITSELDTSVPSIDTGSALKHLNDSFVTSDFEYLTTTSGTITQSEIDNIGILGLLHVFQNHKRAIDTSHSPVVETRLHTVVTQSSIFVEVEDVLLDLTRSRRCRSQR
mmetsp:Transcript_38540/g.97013  ORF Transcript_38540/g.97013 Transcript_38540/m.97013 type:complete len:354 (-) Transcript_38540:194-1255(-)